jgi:hypothetical protein
MNAASSLFWQALRGELWSRGILVSELRDGQEQLMEADAYCLRQLIRRRKSLNGQDLRR